MRRDTLDSKQSSENERGRAAYSRQLAEAQSDREASVEDASRLGRSSASGLCVIPKSQHGYGQKVVLIVDCEPISRNVFVRALERLGYQALEAANIQEAMTICRDQRRHIDVLIAEFMLTDGKGTELAAEIRTHWPDIPVLLTCGIPIEGWSDVHRMRFAELGIRAGFLPKPFQILALDSKLTHLTDSLAQRDDNQSPQVTTASE